MRQMTAEPRRREIGLKLLLLGKTGVPYAPHAN